MVTRLRRKGGEERKEREALYRQANIGKSSECRNICGISVCIPGIRVGNKAQHKYQASAEIDGAVNRDAS